MLEAPHIENVHYDPTAPVMNREQIDMLLMLEDEEDSSSLAAELFELYRTGAVEKLAQLDQICAERDGVSLRKLVHYIAGSAGNLGLMRLHSFYRGIEEAIEHGVLEDFEACARLIPIEFELSCRAFSQALDLEWED